jgi:hypothetical protein
MLSLSWVFFISSTLILQMANASNRNNNNNNGENNQNVNLLHLESPTHGSVVLKLPSPTSIASTLHHTAAQNLEDILVAYQFPDVFPEDLLGTPLDRDVEFTIEL